LETDMKKTKEITHTTGWLADILRRDCELEIQSRDRETVIVINPSGLPEELRSIEWVNARSNTSACFGETISATIAVDASKEELYGVFEVSPNAFKAEAYNSGGGIWICEMDLGDGTYAVIDSESIVCDVECLSIYRYAEEPFMPEDMFFSENVENLDELHMAVYKHMKNVLIAEMNRLGYSL